MSWYITLKSLSPVISQASPMIAKQCEPIVPNPAQIAIAGIHPVPAAIPADSVNIPAPATLLTRLKTDAAIVDLLSSFLLSFPPPLPMAFTDSLHEFSKSELYS